MSKPDNTQELDEILGHWIKGHINGSASGFYVTNQTKQDILDWHNKQVEEVLDRAKQRFHEPIEHDGSYISISVIDKTFDELIQAHTAQAVREHAQKILDAGHNLDCISCGFKDKIATESLNQEKNGETE